MLEEFGFRILKFFKLIEISKTNSAMGLKTKELITCERFTYLVRLKIK